MLKFYFEKGLGIVSPRHVMYNFARKMFHVSFVGGGVPKSNKG